MQQKQKHGKEEICICTDARPLFITSVMALCNCAVFQSSRCPIMEWHEQWKEIERLIAGSTLERALHVGNFSGSELHASRRSVQSLFGFTAVAIAHCSEKQKRNQLESVQCHGNSNLWKSSFVAFWRSCYALISNVGTGLCKMQPSLPFFVCWKI